MWKLPVGRPPAEMMAMFNPAYGGEIAPAYPGERKTTWMNSTGH